MATDFETAMVNVLNELECTFSLKAEQTAALKAFIEKKGCVCRPSYGVW
ncbi:hypothetical protein P7M41_26210 [Vibrio parahaemolyticus]|nr:hypothetical protein [Vibrio parahaemolyticus]